MSSRASSIVAILFAVSLLTAVILGGGWFTAVVLDAGPDTTDRPAASPYAACGAALAGLAALVCGAIAVRRRDRRTLMQATAASLGICMAAGFGEVACRAVTPAWPARALHGVSPQAWSAATADAGTDAGVPIGINSWSQRDRERTIVPGRGVRRIAFIGDSFLEEGSALPVSVATEQKFGRADVEIVNLGVSATGPDEYFDRLRGVAVPLGAAHCCLFVFAGNDFVSPQRTLPTWWGIAAAEPRPAFLPAVGLAGWNHLFTHRQRPVAQAWLAGSSLALDEKSRHAALQQADDNAVRQMLLGASLAAGAARLQLATVLNREGIEKFFDILRNPDQNRFRSYYLKDALLAASQPGWTWEPNSEQIAWDWTERAARLTRSRGMGLTVVVIPEGFQVDDRMREQWLPLADMRPCTKPCRDAAEKFVERARHAGLDVVDLHDALHESRGTYLNLDGHWSEAGVELVSNVLAQHLSDVLARKGIEADGAR